jgi:hypothetical protein
MRLEPVVAVPGIVQGDVILFAPAKSPDQHELPDEAIGEKTKSYLPGECETVLDLLLHIAKRFSRDEEVRR